MIVLKSKLSGYFYKGCGAWTIKPLGAKVFDNEHSASDCAKRECLGNVHVLDLGAMKELRLAG